MNKFHQANIGDINGSPIEDDSGQVMVIVIVIVIVIVVVIVMVIIMVYQLRMMVGK